MWLGAAAIWLMALAACVVSNEAFTADSAPERVPRLATWIKWPTLRLNNLSMDTSATISPNSYMVLMVYDIVSCKHRGNVDLYLTYMQRYHELLIYESLLQRPVFDDAAPKELRSFELSYVFLLNKPSQAKNGRCVEQSQSINADVAEFCAKRQQEGVGCWQEIKPTSSDQEQFSSAEDGVFRQPLQWDVLLAAVSRRPRAFDGLYVQRSHMVGPVVPRHFLAPVYSRTFIAHVTSSVQHSHRLGYSAVLSNAHVHRVPKRQSVVLTLHSTHFPLLLHEAAARALAVHFAPAFANTSAMARHQRNVMLHKTLVMALLSTGLRVHVLSPTLMQIDWLEYYNLCYLKSYNADLYNDPAYIALNAFVPPPGKNIDRSKRPPPDGPNFINEQFNGCKHISGLAGGALATTVVTPVQLRLANGAVDGAADGAAAERATVAARYPSLLVSHFLASYSLSPAHLAQLHAAMRRAGRHMQERGPPHDAAPAPGPLVQRPPEKTLVVYVYREGDGRLTPQNYKTFQRNAMLPTNLVDFLLVVEGKHSLRFPRAQFNVRVVKRALPCLRLHANGSCAEPAPPLSTWTAVLAHLFVTGGSRAYRDFIVLTSEFMGPFLSPSWPQEALWTVAVTSPLRRRAGRVAAVGLPVEVIVGATGCEYVLSSSLLAFDHSALDVWVEARQPPQVRVLLRAFAEDLQAPLGAGGGPSQIKTRTLLRSLLSLTAMPSNASAEAKDADVDIFLRDLATLSVQNCGPALALLLGCVRDAGELRARERELAAVLWTAGKATAALHGDDEDDAADPQALCRMLGARAELTLHPYEAIFVLPTEAQLASLLALLVDPLRFPVPSSPKLYSGVHSIQTHPLNHEHLTASLAWREDKYPADTTADPSARAEELYHAFPINPDAYYLTRFNAHYHVDSGVSKTMLAYSHNLQFEGAPMWLWRVAQRFARSYGYVVKVYSLTDVAPPAGRPSGLYPRFEADGMEVVHCARAAPYVMLKAHAAFRQWREYFEGDCLALRHDFSPSLVLYNTVLYVRYVTALRASYHRYLHVKHLWAVHEAELFDAVKAPNNYAYAHDFRELLYVGSGAYLHADKMLFVSDSAREYVSRFDFGRLTTIRGFTSCNGNLSDEQVRQERRERRVSARQRLGIPQHAFVITNMGTVCRRKQQHWLLDLFTLAQLHKVRPDVPLVVFLIGFEDKSAYERDLQARIAAADLSTQLRMVRKSSDPWSYVHAADLHTSVSTHESFPLNTLEVMCLGVPVVATPAFGLREQIIRSGEDGILAPGVRNFQGFQSIMRSLLLRHRTTGDELEAIGLEGRRTVLRHFTDRAMATQFTDLLASLAPAVSDGQLLHLGPDGAEMVFHRRAEASSLLPTSLPASAIAVSAAAQSTGKTCAVLRFDRESRDEVRRSLAAWQAQHHSDWEVLLVPTERTDLAFVYPLLVAFNHHEPVPANGSSSLPAFNRIRLVVYHDLLAGAKPAQREGRRLRLTDLAVQHCSEGARWLVVADAGHWLHPSALEQLDSRADVVAFDYYSPAWPQLLGRQGAAPCERLLPERLSAMDTVRDPPRWDLLSCVPIAALPHRRHGLGAYAFSLKRFLHEGRLFAEVGEEPEGAMVEQLMEDGWVLKAVSPLSHSPGAAQSCLVEQGRSYHTCTLAESDDVAEGLLVWDDSLQRCRPNDQGEQSGVVPRCVVSSA